MYAIRNKRTKKWVYGTDYRYSPRRQRTSFDRALTKTLIHGLPDGFPIPMDDGR